MSISARKNIDSGVCSNFRPKEPKELYCSPDNQKARKAAENVVRFEVELSVVRRSAASAAVACLSSPDADSDSQTTTNHAACH